MLLTCEHICPNNLPLWQSMTKPQQTNEHMREVINHSTHIHLLNTIKSILTQTLEKLCKKRVMASKLWQPVFLKHFKQNSSKHLCLKTEIIDWIKVIRNMCMEIEKKQHM